MSCEQVSVEFTPEKLRLFHDRETDFAESSWKWFSPRAYTVYRIMVAILIVAFVIFDAVWEWQTVYPQMPAYWLIYASNLCLILLCIAYIYLGVLACIHTCHDPDLARTVKGYSAAWFLYNVSVNLIWVVTLIYWMSLSNSNMSIFTTVSATVKHIAPAVLIMVDLMVNAIPIRLCHGIYPICVALLYNLANLLYWVAGGTGPNTIDVYPGMKWNTPTGAIAGPLISSLLAILMQALLYAMFYFRDFIRDLASGGNLSGDRTSHTSRPTTPHSVSSSSGRASPKPATERDPLPEKDAVAKRKGYSSIPK